MTINENRLNSARIICWAGYFGLSGVVLGAFGAHALRDTLIADGTLEVWRTAVDYQFWHALALLALGLATGAENIFLTRASRLLNWAACCWGAGIVLFSGSLYALALGGPRWLGPVTPLGGTLLISGWALIFAAGWRARKT